MRMTYDPDADAVYVKLTGLDTGFGETVVGENGVIVDTDDLGAPRGFEFLFVSTHPIVLGGLPSNVAAALQEFIGAGSLSSNTQVRSEY